MPSRLQYDPVTKKMEKVESPATASSGGPVTSFMVAGETLDTLLKFAKEDGLDLSTKANKGRAVNSYIRAAVEEFIKARNKADKPAVPAGSRG